MAAASRDISFDHFARILTTTSPFLRTQKTPLSDITLKHLHNARPHQTGTGHDIRRHTQNESDMQMRLERRLTGLNQKQWESEIAHMATTEGHCKILGLKGVLLLGS